MTYCFQPAITIFYDRASQDVSISFRCKHHAVGRRQTLSEAGRTLGQSLGRGGGGGVQGKGPSVMPLPGFPSHGA